MRTRPTVPTFSLTLIIVCGLLGVLLSPTIVWDPHSYDGGVNYVQQDQPASSELGGVTLDSCKAYIADGMAAADGYSSGGSFLIGCYRALGG